jgi:hypothetical protein
MHNFVHTLDTVPKNWYLELEVHRGTIDWEELSQNVKVTFSLESYSTLINASFQVIRSNIFMEEEHI